MNNNFFKKTFPNHFSARTTVRPSFSIRRTVLAMLVASSVLATTNAHSAIAGWDFTGNNAANATFAATAFDANLDSSSLITRGANAGASAANNSFRTEGFKNEGITVANTDYFQITLSAASGFLLSLSTIDARFKGTDTFAQGSGVSAQFAYSLNGSSFTLIGSPFVLSVVSSIPAAGLTMPQIDLGGISALQNVDASTTVSFRYYASGQTTSGGWGFFSDATGHDGLDFGGTLTAVPEPTTWALIVFGTVFGAVQLGRLYRRRLAAAG